jgi:hypothetical protein
MSKPSIPLCQCHGQGEDLLRPILESLLGGHEWTHKSHFEHSCRIYLATTLWGLRFHLRTGL